MFYLIKFASSVSIVASQIHGDLYGLNMAGTKIFSHVNIAFQYK